MFHKAAGSGGICPAWQAVRSTSLFRWRTPGTYSVRFLPFFCGGWSPSVEATTRKFRQVSRPTFAELFTPKLITILQEGYGWSGLKSDVFAGLTVAIVAAPLSMAIAIASGASPERGLYTAIVGGFLVSLLGGSRFQIGGPAGAFIVLVSATVEHHGIDGLILATMMAGIFLMAIGLLRLGTYIKFIPYPVTVGFTSGIAIIIFVSQIKDLLGLYLPGGEPGLLHEKLTALAAALPTVNVNAMAVAVATIAMIAAVQRWRPAWPGILIAVGAVTVAAALLHLPVSTIGSTFGELPRTLPQPQLAVISYEKLRAVLPDALAFALLGAIESLLSAVVADAMTGRRHRSNCELVAQGVANIGSALFGGICVTGTIARTATNVRAGARGPVAGMLHSIFLLLFLLIAAPLASFIPLAALAGVLAVVCWTMAERHAFATLLRSRGGDALVLLATFMLTIFVGLIEGIVVGFAIGAVLVIKRLSEMAGVEAHSPLVPEDRADNADGPRTAYDAQPASDPDIIVYRITGALFFGAASSIGLLLDEAPTQYRALVLDFTDVPFADSTGINTIAGVCRTAARKGAKIYLTGTAPELRESLISHGIEPPLVQFAARIDEAVGLLKLPAAAL
jgi:SulP family sulfate permease